MYEENMWRVTRRCFLIPKLQLQFQLLCVIISHPLTIKTSAFNEEQPSEHVPLFIFQSIECVALEIWLFGLEWSKLNRTPLGVVFAVFTQETDV